FWSPLSYSTSAAPPTTASVSHKLVFCPVCRQLVYPNEAVQTQCTHPYCKPCLTYVLSTTRACPYDGYLVTDTDSKALQEANPVLADAIGRVTVHCLYHKSGCTWQGPLSE
ncbi:hypothetical protein KI387_041389, partial [Taxus chinensis]